MAPLVSVVIPSYGHERFVAAAIASVFGQTHRPLELVVVDDGSRDGSRAVIAAALAACPIERALLIEQDNAGADAAIERGLAEARGDVFAILNSDDVYHPERFARMLPSLQRGAALAFSRVEAVDESGGRVPPEHGWQGWYANGLHATPSCPTLGFSLLLNNTCVTSSNLLFTRALKERVGAFSSHRFSHDWDFLMRSVLVAEPVEIPESLLGYRLHNANATDSLRDVQESELSDALDRYLAAALARPPANVLAPAPANWPHLLPRFLDQRRFMFGTETIARYVRPDLMMELRAECARLAGSPVSPPRP